MKVTNISPDTIYPNLAILSTDVHYRKNKLGSVIEIPT
jgi:hypothetical protein